MEPTQIDQQPVMELADLLAFDAQGRPLLLGLAAEVVGELAGLGQRRLGLAGDLGSELLGLGLGLVDDGSQGLVRR